MSSRQLTVTKANSLVEATYHLTLAEQRLLLLVISRLDSRVELDSRIPHTITAAEVMTVFQVGESRAYQILEEAAEESKKLQRQYWAEAQKEHTRIATEELGVSIHQPHKEPFLDAVKPLHEELKAKSEEMKSTLEEIARQR